MADTFFHIDRTNSLEPGDVLELDWSFRLGASECPEVSPENEQILRDMYPEGLSRHGFRYASAMVVEDNNVSVPGKSKPLVTAIPISNTNPEYIFSDPHSARYEWFFELIRQAEFESCQSRFQSVFGWRDKSDIETQTAVQGRDTQLVKLSCENYEKKDEEFLKFNSFSSAMKNARKYWSGDGSPDPTWEILMEPPVQVVEIVE